MRDVPVTVPDAGCVGWIWQERSQYDACWP